MPSIRYVTADQHPYSIHAAPGSTNVAYEKKKINVDKKKNKIKPIPLRRNPFLKKGATPSKFLFPETKKKP